MPGLIAVLLLPLADPLILKHLLATTLSTTKPYNVSYTPFAIDLKELINLTPSILVLDKFNLLVASSAEDLNQGAFISSQTLKCGSFQFLITLCVHL